MKDIKEKPKMKTAKVMQAGQRIPRDAKNAFLKVKEQSSPLSEQYESPEDYAIQTLEDKTKQTANRASNATDNNIRKTVNRIKEHRAKSTDRSILEDDVHIDKPRNATYEGGKRHAEKQAETYRRNTGLKHRAGTKKVKKNTVSPVKQISKGTAKTAQRTVKTTHKTVKTAERTVKASAKATKTTAKATAKAAQAAKQAAVKAAQAAAKAAQTAAKAVATAVKAIIAAIKGLIAAIAAGGWVVVVVILIIAVVAIILCSAFGVFWSNETAEGTPMTEVISTIDLEFTTNIDNEIARLSAGGADEIRILYTGDTDGDSAAVYNWNDVLAVYAVFATTDKANPMDVAVITSENAQVLRSFFLTMNTVSYSTSVTEEEAEAVDEETGEVTSVTKTVKTITVDQKSMNYKEAAELFGFTDYQMEILEEMMTPEYNSYYAALVGVDIYDGATLTDIVTNLPPNAQGSEVVKAASTKLGCPYVWGAKGDNKFDCSGFAYWAVHEVNPSLGSKLYTNAAGQAKYCYEHGYSVGRDELQPGDLVFWQKKTCSGCGRWNEVHHVGIYAGNGKVIEASSSKGRVVIRNLWEGSNYPLFMFARPYS